MSHSKQQLNYLLLVRGTNSNGKIGSVVLNFFNEHQGDVNYVCQSKQELLDLDYWIINLFSVYLLKVNGHIGSYGYADNTIMLAFLYIKSKKYKKK